MSGNLAQQRPRIRRHVVDAGDTAHHLGAFQLRNSAAGALDDFFQRFVGGTLRKIVGIHRPLPVEIADQKFVMRIGAKIGCRHRIDAGAASALHPRRIPQNGDLVIFAFDRKSYPTCCKQRTASTGRWPRSRSARRSRLGR